MPRRTSIDLGDHLDHFVDAQIANGRYASASDVVRAGLRLLQEEEFKIQALRDALVEGEQSGTDQPFDIESFLKTKRSERNQ